MVVNINTNPTTLEILQDNMTKEKMKNSYIFPDVMAKAMSKVDQRTQYEASMMSMAMMSIGLILTAIYMGFFSELALWFRITIAINSFFGIIFMYSYIITTFQQYQNYMEAVELQKQLGLTDENTILDLKGGEEHAEN